MSRNYNLNPEHAKQANSSLRITESGKYVGRFTRAEAVTSKKDTEGVEFAFESESGQSADFLTLWTFNKEGKELFGLNILNALMTCMKVRAMTSAQAMVEKWDSAAGAKGKFQATVYPDLMNKPIGVVLQREEYVKGDGSTGSKFNIYACFDPATGMIAGEILDKAPKAEKLDKILSTLRDKVIDGVTRAPAPRATAGAVAGGFNDMDDDIPF